MRTQFVFPLISITLLCLLLAETISGNPCLAGTYLAITGASSDGACLKCPTGTYQNWDGASSCNLCPIGSYCPVGSVIFTACPPGTHQPNNGATTIESCLKCPTGTYQDWAGASYCKTCPAGYLCVEGASPIPLAISG